MKTGIKDKNGREISVGDDISLTDLEMEMIEVPFIVEENERGFVISNDQNSWDLDEETGLCCEIIN